MSAQRKFKLGRREFLKFVGIGGAAVLFTPLETLAAPYYEGKTITIVVGVGPGGGYDRMARMLQRYLTKHIPGKPTVVIENMPGASSILAANRIYNLAKPDGLTIGAPQRGIPFAQLLKVDGVKFDVTKYAWIGSTAVESTALAVRSDLPYKTFADLQKANTQLILGGTGPGESSVQFAILLKEFLGLNMKMIYYPSSADVMLAIERKEVDGRAGSYSALKPFIDRGLVRPLIRGKASEPGMENLPVDEDLVTDKRGKIFMSMRSAGELIGRPYVAPPRTPPEVMNILREAFAKVIKDPELKKESQKNQMEVQYVSAKDCQNVLNTIFRQPDDVIKEFSKYIKF